MKDFISMVWTGCFLAVVVERELFKNLILYWLFLITLREEIITREIPTEKNIAELKIFGMNTSLSKERIHKIFKLESEKGELKEHNFWGKTWELSFFKTEENFYTKIGNIQNKNITPSTFIQVLSINNKFFKTMPKFNLMNRTTEFIIILDQCIVLYILGN